MHGLSDGVPEPIYDGNWRDDDDAADDGGGGEDRGAARGGEATEARVGKEGRRMTRLLFGLFLMISFLWSGDVWADEDKPTPMWWCHKYKIALNHYAFQLGQGDSSDHCVSSYAECAERTTDWMTGTVTNADGHTHDSDRWGYYDHGKCYPQKRAWIVGVKEVVDDTWGILVFASKKECLSMQRHLRKNRSGNVEQVANCVLQGPIDR